MATRIRPLEVERSNGIVQKVVMVLETIEDKPIIRYRVIFVPDPKNRAKMKVLAKCFYNELGSMVSDKANVPSEIFNRMARTAVAIMFGKYE